MKFGHAWAVAQHIPPLREEGWKFAAAIADPSLEQFLQRIASSKGLSQDGDKQPMHHLSLFSPLMDGLAVVVNTVPDSAPWILAVLSKGHNSTKDQPKRVQIVSSEKRETVKMYEI